MGRKTLKKLHTYLYAKQSSHSHHIIVVHVERRHKLYRLKVCIWSYGYGIYKSNPNILNLRPALRIYDEQMNSI